MCKIVDTELLFGVRRASDVAAAGLTMRPAELAHAFVGGTGITLAARSRVERLDLARYERST